jgi:hypothetical protein
LLGERGRIAPRWRHLMVGHAAGLRLFIFFIIFLLIFDAKANARVAAGEHEVLWVGDER